MYDPLEKATKCIGNSIPNAKNITLTRSIDVGGRINPRKLWYARYETVDSGGQKEAKEGLVYDDSLHDGKLFGSLDEFIGWYGSRRPEGKSIATLITEWSGGVAGVIAIAIVAVLLYEYAKNPVSEWKPPEMLAHAFSIVLGYYFGSKVSSKV